MIYLSFFFFFHSFWKQHGTHQPFTEQCKWLFPCQASEPELAQKNPSEIKNKRVGFYKTLLKVSEVQGGHLNLCWFSFLRLAFLAAFNLLCPPLVFVILYFFSLSNTGSNSLIKNRLFLLELEKTGCFYWKRELKGPTLPPQKGTTDVL